MSRVPSPQAHRGADTSSQTCQPAVPPRPAHLPSGLPFSAFDFVTLCAVDSIYSLLFCKPAYPRGTSPVDESGRGSSVVTRERVLAFVRARSSRCLLFGTSRGSRLCRPPNPRLGERQEPLGPAPSLMGQDQAVQLIPKCSGPQLRAHGQNHSCSTWAGCVRQTGTGWTCLRVFPPTGPGGQRAEATGDAPGPQRVALTFPVSTRAAMSSRAGPLAMKKAQR